MTRRWTAEVAMARSLGAGMMKIEDEQCDRCESCFDSTSGEITGQAVLS